MKVVLEGAQGAVLQAVGPASTSAVEMSGWAGMLATIIDKGPQLEDRSACDAGVACSAATPLLRMLRS